MARTRALRKPAPRPRYPKNPLPPQHQRRPGLEARMHPSPQFRGGAYRSAGKLAGRVALITGGDSGIGRAVATFFAREGANVAIVYLTAEERDAQATRAAVEEIGMRCVLIAGDVGDPQFCREAVAATVKQLGSLDILVNNAAFQKTVERLEDLDDAQIERTFRTNILGYMFMARAALPQLKSGASIINTGSITGLQGSSHLLDYAATKGAIHAFTKSLAQNLVERGVRVNCVAPGPVWTPLNVADRKPSQVARHGADTPMHRPGQPEEMAPAYVFFASNADSSYITGEVLTLLGGQTTAG
jgi:NAD(P)-dependent dehydrogenase (short-subunit alcohol dehydrogenase family)